MYVNFSITDYFFIKFALLNDSKKIIVMAQKSGLMLFIGTIICSYMTAQEVQIIPNNKLNTQINTTSSDTVTFSEIDPSELDAIPSVRASFEKANKTYKAAQNPTQRLARLTKSEMMYLSPEALYWKNWRRDPETIIPSYMTLRDTSIVNPLFVPIVFKGGLFPRDINTLKLYDKDFASQSKTKYQIFKPDTSLFQEEVLTDNLRQQAYNYVRVKHPEYFRYSERDMPKGAVAAAPIQKETYEPTMIKVTNDVSFDDVEAPHKFLPNRRYWISHFESTIQFAQNYISPNWHKGGVSNLNLLNRQYFTYNYNKDKVQVNNDIEWKTNMFTAPKDTLRNYKIGDDVFRVHSNVGYRAFNKWYYTFDFTFQTQMFSNYQENTNLKLASFLSPFSVNMGLGMKYELNRAFSNVRHKKLSLSINMAPFSYTFMYSTNKDIDLGRHGFEKNPETGIYKRSLSQVGSTVNATMNFQFNRNISWYSRLYYFTSYDRMLGEFENRLNMTISRFFSTTISLNLRYDDAVAKKDDFDSYLQINELLSFGFNYKW